MYLDEVGMDDLNHLNIDNHRYLSLTGVILQLEYVGDVLIPAIETLKRDVFDCDPDEMIHLHRTDIVKKKGVFGQLRDARKQAEFDRRVFQIISDANYTVVTALVDKLAMTQQAHWQQQHPYHYLAEIMVEKYAQFLERQNDIGDIMPEARQGKKDRELQAQFERVRANGSRFVNADRIQSVIRASKLKFRTKRDNIAGLQLCDLLAHPSHMYVRDVNNHPVQLGPFAIRVRDILVARKYDRSARGRIDGYGIKLCP